MVRLFEILPGFFVWLTLILPIALSFHFPYAVTLFILFYTVWWFLRSLVFAYYLLLGMIRARKTMRVDFARYLTVLHKPEFSAILGRASADEQELLSPYYAEYQSFPLSDRHKAEDLWQVVILATYKEEINILDQSIGALAKSDYDLKRVIVVLATEERDHERGMENGRILHEKYNAAFGGFWVIEHPKNIAGDLPCKGSNIHFAGKEVAKRLTEEGVDPSKVLITTIDADNIVHPQFLATLAFVYLCTPNRKKRSYQALPLLFNNIWQVPIFNRLIALTSTFWHMIQSGRPNRLRNFAAHAQPLDALIEMDFWNPTSIVEDGHQFWRAFFQFKGDHEVIPLFMPIYQDAVQEETYWETLKAQYIQLRRWAWGSTDISFVILNWWKNRDQLPFWVTLRRLYLLVEGHYMWATAPIIITFSTPVPRMLNQAFGQSVEAYNFGFILGIFFNLALVGIFVSILASLMMLPKPPQGWTLKLSVIFMWFLLPFTTIIYGALPAIDAQTRLMLNQRLEFSVTKKIRKAATTDNQPL
jgi:hypothetical protein